MKKETIEGRQKRIEEEIKIDRQKKWNEFTEWMIKHPRGEKKVEKGIRKKTRRKVPKPL